MLKFFSDNHTMLNTGIFSNGLVLTWCYPHCRDNFVGDTLRRPASGFSPRPESGGFLSSVALAKEDRFRRRGNGYGDKMADRDGVSRVFRWRGGAGSRIDGFRCLPEWPSPW